MGTLGADVTRYADQQARAPLGTFVVRLAWIAKPDACAACKQLAAGSPYDPEKLPAWPGDAKIGCRKKPCRCEIHADPDDWRATFGENAG